MVEANLAYIPTPELRTSYNQQFQAISNGQAKSYQDLSKLLFLGREYFGTMFKKDGDIYSFIRDEKTLIPLTSPDFPHFEFDFQQRYMRTARRDIPDVEMIFCENMGAFFSGLAHPGSIYSVRGSEKEFDNSTPQKREQYKRMAENWVAMADVAALEQWYRATGIRYTKADLKRERR